ncbi:MAG: iron-sulfur cluster assembly scaffold protein [Thermoplasmata archaeon]
MDEFILDYIISVYRNPKNFGRLEDSYSMEEGNPFCGDKIKLFVKLNNNIIKEIKFTGEGCTISIFSAEILSENFVNKNIGDIMKMSEEEYLKLIPISLTPTRQKCALLSFRILKNILKDINQK